MNLKVEKLYELNQGLNRLLDKELPIKVAFLIQRNFKKVGDELKNSNEIRQKLVDKYKEYAEETYENGSFRLPDDKKKEFEKELKELLSQEVEIHLGKINLEDLGETIEPRVLALIDIIIKEDE